MENKSSYTCPHWVVAQYLNIKSRLSEACLSRPGFCGSEGSRGGGGNSWKIVILDAEHNLNNHIYLLVVDCEAVTWKTWLAAAGEIYLHWPLAGLPKRRQLLSRMQTWSPAWCYASWGKHLCRLSSSLWCCCNHGQKGGKSMKSKQLFSMQSDNRLTINHKIAWFFFLHKHSSGELFQYIFLIVAADGKNKMPSRKHNLEVLHQGCYWQWFACTIKMVHLRSAF